MEYDLKYSFWNRTATFLCLTCFQQSWDGIKLRLRYDEFKTQWCCVYLNSYWCSLPEQFYINLACNNYIISASPRNAALSQDPTQLSTVKIPENINHYSTSNPAMDKLLMRVISLQHENESSLPYIDFAGVMLSSLSCPKCPRESWEWCKAFYYCYSDSLLPSQIQLTGEKCWDAVCPSYLHGRERWKQN